MPLSITGLVVVSLPLKCAALLTLVVMAVFRGVAIPLLRPVLVPMILHAKPLSTVPTMTGELGQLAPRPVELELQLTLAQSGVKPLTVVSPVMSLP